MIIENFSGSEKVRNGLLVSNDKYLFIQHFIWSENIREQMHSVWSSRTMQ